MTKIQPIKPFMNAKSGKKVLNNLKKDVKNSVPKSTPKTSKLDLSTEELGFYTYNGKVINIVFPR